MAQRSFARLVFILVILALLRACVRPALAQETFETPGGYIDNAQIRSMFRLRYDAGFDLNRPDRAEFFYATWAGTTDHPHAIKNTDQIISQRGARGPLEIPESVDFQDVSLYFESARSDRLSVFGEFAVRYVDFQGELLDEEAFNTPSFNRNYDKEPTHTAGLSDLQLGFKYALWNTPDAVLTLQLRTYIPTGNPRLALGTGHVSVEPGVLFNKRLTENLALMGQGKLWAPIAGGPNAGNIAIYGLGVSRDFWSPNSLRITPVAEFVGWTVLNGFESLSSPTGAPIVPNTAIVPRDDELRRFSDGAPLDSQDPRPAPTSHGVQDVSGHTIVNAKIGIRTYLNPYDDIYVGWGHSLTGRRWYRDVIRVEYRRSF